MHVNFLPENVLVKDYSTDGVIARVIFKFALDFTWLEK